MVWIPAQNEDVLMAIRGINWDHSFIREAHLVSPSYILPESIGTVAPDHFPSARVFVSSASERAPGLELLFVDVIEFSVSFDIDLEPNVLLADDEIIWSFYKNHRPIISKKLFYKFLNSDTWGHDMRYGWEDMYNKAGELEVDLND